IYLLKIKLRFTVVAELDVLAITVFCFVILKIKLILRRLKMNNLKANEVHFGFFFAIFDEGEVHVGFFFAFVNQSEFHIGFLFSLVDHGEIHVRFLFALSDEFEIHGGTFFAHFRV
uniref:hypothetical protein n=1 Tax=Salmonella sp. s58078 TaxID=3159699 RepID=UPI0039810082